MKKGLFFTFILLGVMAYSFAQSIPSGTFSSENGRVSAAFAEDMVIIHIDGEPNAFGFVSVSGSTLFLRMGKDAEPWKWTIIDTNTIKDHSGAYFKKINSLTGTYRYSERYYITFTGNTFAGKLGSDSFSGTFTISGNKLILNISNGKKWEWNIAAINVIRDHDGDSWRKN